MKCFGKQDRLTVFVVISCAVIMLAVVAVGSARADTISTIHDITDFDTRIGVPATRLWGERRGSAVAEDFEFPDGLGIWRITVYVEIRNPSVEIRALDVLLYNWILLPNGITPTVFVAGRANIGVIKKRLWEVPADENGNGYSAGYSVTTIRRMPPIWIRETRRYTLAVRVVTAEQTRGDDVRILLNAATHEGTGITMHGDVGNDGTLPYGTRWTIMGGGKVLMDVELVD